MGCEVFISSFSWMSFGFFSVFPFYLFIICGLGGLLTSNCSVVFFFLPSNLLFCLICTINIVQCFSKKSSTVNNKVRSIAKLFEVIWLALLKLQYFTL
jgi:hypothetical protein